MGHYGACGTTQWPFSVLDMNKFMSRLTLELMPKKILLVEDEESLAEMYKIKFEREDFEVTILNSGSAVLETAKNENPSIILLDIMMPKADGLTALNKLKNEKGTSSIPVIMLTGANHELNEQLARNLGAHAYLRKPVTPRELLDAVSKTI